MGDLVIRWATPHDAPGVALVHVESWRAAHRGLIDDGRDPEYADLGELAGLYAHPEHRSHGVGHALIERVEDELRADGWREAYLWCCAATSGRSGFYERHGWAADGARKVADFGDASLVELRHHRVLG